MTFSNALILALSLCLAPALADEDEVFGDGPRIENEYKLSIPVEKTQEVWEYLEKQYGPNRSTLKEEDGFKVSLSDELFYDRYFDTPDLILSEQQNGIRHRMRLIPDNPSHPKHRRSLVQVKLSRPDDPNPLNRTEIKFKVRKSVRQQAERLPLLRLIRKTDQVPFLTLLTKHSIPPLKLTEILNLKQRRRRVYIRYRDQDFATITLDEMESKRFFHTFQATEAEIELNEVRYTQAKEEERKTMQGISDGIKFDLEKHFPFIHQDQVPKYTKAVKYFEKNVPLYKVLLKVL